MGCAESAENYLMNLGQRTGSQLVKGWIVDEILLLCSYEESFGVASLALGMVVPLIQCPLVMAGICDLDRALAIFLTFLLLLLLLLLLFLLLFICSLWLLGWIIFWGRSCAADKQG